MDKVLYLYDARDAWRKPAEDAFRRRGWTVYQVEESEDVPSGATGAMLLFPHANPNALARDRSLSRDIDHRTELVFVTDLHQIGLYDDKWHQSRRYADLMPDTWLLASHDAALRVVRAYDTWPLVSKAAVGASSVNVRILKDREHAERHLSELFGRGVQVHHCDSPMRTVTSQQGYAILQRFVPHDTTYRVNVVGNQRAVFLRRNYRDRPVAQTGNVSAVTELTPEIESLLAWVDTVCLPLVKTQWCALDVLRTPDGWTLLETSLRWPWPGAAGADQARFFPSGRSWSDMWDVLVDELEAGSFRRG